MHLLYIIPHSSSRASDHKLLGYNTPMNIDLNHQIHDLLPRGAEGEALKQAIQEHIADLLGQDRRDCADIALSILRKD